MRATYHADIKKEVIEQLRHHQTPITSKLWDLAYDIVRANHQADTIKWKIENVTVTL